MLPGRGHLVHLCDLNIYKYIFNAININAVCIIVIIIIRVINN